MPAATSSRESRQGAGWDRDDCRPGRYLELMRACGADKRRSFGWLNPRPLWESRNDRVARTFGDPVNDLRRGWMRTLGAGNSDLLIKHSDSGPASFLVMGDTGEGDASQWVVVPPLLARAGGTEFLFICSDVIYPAGGVGSYRDRFFAQYADYAPPIYAVPGNHDWYDDGEAFMRWFCGARERPHGVGSPRFQLLRRLHVWRHAPRLPKDADALGARHDRPGRRPSQPAPYLAIDVGPLRLLGIDTGIIGSIDRDQADWLRRMAAGPRPKLLLTGKPIYVDGEHHPGPIEGGGVVDDIVTNPDNHFLGAIGGDIHNYQRYLVRVPDGRRLLYLVSGGGGAFMHETHTIPNLDTRHELAADEADFRCYPLRGDSLARYSQLYARKLGIFGGRRLVLDPDEAAAIMGERLGLTPTRPDARAVTVTARGRRIANTLFKLPARGRRSLHLPFSEWLDWNQPPLFKNFLRIDATDTEIHIHCHGVTGCGRDESNPAVEDHLVATLDGGAWTWRVAGATDWQLRPGGAAPAPISGGPPPT